MAGSHSTPPRLSDRLFRGPSAGARANFVAFGAAILATAPVLVAVVNALATRDWTAVGAWATLLGALLAGAYMLWPRPIPSPPQATVVFRPFGGAADIPVWPRPDDVTRLEARLLLDAKSLTVVTGASGAGKSVLLRELLPSSLVTADCHYLSTTAALSEVIDQIKTLVRHSERAQVIIIDQFEQHLAWLQTLGRTDRDRERQVARDAFDVALAADNCRLILALPQEWYYRLRWLGNIVPRPIDSVDIAGVRIDQDNETEAIASRSFTKVLGTPADAHSVFADLGQSGLLLPLELQIVGATLEWETAVHTPDVRFLAEPDGLDRAIARYFDEILRGAPDKRVTAKVLYAFSAAARFRSQHSFGQIADVVFEHATDVRTALNYLVSQDLVQALDANVYRLSHDYVGRYFHDRSGEQLEPTERDNILFQVDAYPNGWSKALATRTEQDAASRSSFGVVVAGLLTVILTARLLSFGHAWATQINGQRSRLLIGGWILDTAWLPMYVAFIPWMLYVTAFYHRVFRHLRERTLGRVLSRAAVANMFLSAAAAILFPPAWLAAIAWAGLGLGIRLVLLSRNGDLNPIARARLWSMGRSTTFNMLVLGIVGAGGIALSVHYVHSSRALQDWIEVGSLVAAAMTYVCYAFATIHIRRAALPSLLGIISRSGFGVVRRSDS